jgi:CRISPR-associated protein Csm5
MPDYQRFTLKVSTLTPLHIGSGQTLLYEYDYAVYRNRTWRINDAALLEAQDVDDLKATEVLARTPPAQLLQDADYTEDSPFFRYVIRGTPRSEKTGAQLQEQLKDVFDRPYLPGSSLKGALRTTLAWYGWKDLHLKPSAGRLGQRSEWAAQSYEHEIFGGDPNHDFLRALQVEDSRPVDTSRLILINVDILNMEGGMGHNSIPVELEAVRGDTIFESTIKLDWALYSDWAKQNGLHLSGESWLRSLAKVVNEHARKQVERQLQWLKKANVPHLQSFYEQLYNARLSPHQFLLQLGWGTGWEDKTFGSHLQQDPAFMERILHDYRLSRARGRRVGDLFPLSRRIVVQATRAPDGRLMKEPRSPLGWVLVEMQPI